MPSAFSSPRPAASTSRANSMPPVPTKRRACISEGNSLSTSSTSVPSTPCSRMSSLVSFSTSEGRSWASTAPASSLDSWARKTAALRRPGSSLRATTTGMTVVGAAPTSCSTLAMLNTHLRWGTRAAAPRCLCYRRASGPLGWPAAPSDEWLRDSSLGLREPAAEHGGDLVGTLADHLRDLAADLLPLRGRQLGGPVVQRGVADALDLDALRLRLLVRVLLVLLAAAA